jgi:hypothetical protein
MSPYNILRTQPSPSLLIWTPGSPVHEVRFNIDTRRVARSLKASALSAFTSHRNPTGTPRTCNNAGYDPGRNIHPHGISKSYLPAVHPWYCKPDPQLLTVMSDFWLTLLAHIIAYWLLCFFFEILDRADWVWLKRYKIHESPEVTSRNRGSKTHVLAAVIFQQVMQIALGYFWVDTNAETGGPVSTHVPRMEALAPTVLDSLKTLVGSRVATYLWLHKAQDLVYYVYWWAIPLAQLFAGL